MRKKITVFFACLMILCLSVTATAFAAKYIDYVVSKKASDAQFDFPGNFSAPELTIDGLATEEEWQNSDWIAAMGKDNNMRVKFFRGEKALFVLFDVVDTNLLTYADENQSDSVNKSDSVEFYLCTEVDASSKPQTDDYQLNFTVHGYSRIMQGTGLVWGMRSTLLLDYEIVYEGTLDNESDIDSGYTIELMLPYDQLEMEPGDMVAFSLGHVEKSSNPRNQAGSGWYGWNYGGSFVEPQSPAQYVVLDKDNKIYKMGEQPVDSVTMIGNVQNSITGEAIAGASVKMGSFTATTDAAGKYTFTDVPCADYTVLVEAEGYYQAMLEIPASRIKLSNGGTLTDYINLVPDTEAPPATKLTGKVVLGSKALKGATVSVDGTELSAVTDEQGAYTIENVAIGTESIVITVDAEGYEPKSYSFSPSDLTPGGVSKLASVDMLPYTFIADNWGNLNMKWSIAHNGTGYSFMFEKNGSFDGADFIELFVDAGESGATRNSTDYQFILRGDGTYATNRWNSGYKAVAMGGVVYQVTFTGGKTVVLFELPYEAIGTSALEAIGISIGSLGGGVWVGWGYDAYVGYNKIGYVAPEIPADYMRFGPDGSFYGADNNKVSLNDTTVNGTLYGGLKPLAGATVKLMNGETEVATATSDASGAFSFADVKVGEEYAYTLKITSMYGEATKAISDNELVAGGVTALSYDLAAYTQIGPKFGALRVGFIPYVGRYADGFIFRFVTTDAFLAGDCIEFFIDTKESATTQAGRQNSTDDYLIKLGASKIDMAFTWKGGDISLGNYSYAVNTVDEITTVTFNLPYSALNVTAEETIGVTFGVWQEDHGAGAGWDGWGYDAVEVFGNGGFVAPEIPADYVRIAPDNRIYGDVDNNPNN